MPDTNALPRVIPAAAAAALLRDAAPVRLLDVRTPGEFSALHIGGAYNVPLDTLGEHAGEIRRSVRVPIILVCQSGQRARKAEAALLGSGIENLHVLDGGVAGWVDAGLPVIRGKPGISLERQVRIVAGGLAAVGGLLGAFVHPLLALGAVLVGGGLVFAGITNTCAMGSLLAQLPYNRSPACDVATMVRALGAGTAPASPGVVS